MNKILLIIFLVVFVGCSQTNVIQKENVNEQVILEPTSETFFKILETNQDGLEYLNKHNNTKVLNFEKISPNDFKILKNQTQYKELYVDLPQKDLYYVEFASSNQLSLITIIDLENNEVVKIFGVLIMGME